MPGSRRAGPGAQIGCSRSFLLDAVLGPAQDRPTERDCTYRLPAEIRQNRPIQGLLGTGTLVTVPVGDQSGHWRGIRGRTRPSSGDSADQRGQDSAGLRFKDLHDRATRPRHPQRRQHRAQRRPVLAGPGRRSQPVGRAHVPWPGLHLPGPVRPAPAAVPSAAARADPALPACAAGAGAGSGRRRAPDAGLLGRCGPGHADLRNPRRCDDLRDGPPGRRRRDDGSPRGGARARDPSGGDAAPV
mmetsp:Transcript_37529/g.87562  ORF Transcript_37529/g.87562 Transcript_37529/m.87562 type:complete len:243 (+) Transcript_37529:750-1478(+)